MGGHRPPPAFDVEARAIERATARYVATGDHARLDADLTIALTRPLRLLTPPPPPPAPKPRAHEQR